MAKVVWSPRAQADLEEIHYYIAVQNHSLEAANRLIARIDAKCRAYAENNRMGQARPDLAPDIRVFSVGNYVVFYLPKDDGIYVVRVIHDARDYAALLRGES
jgi:toxin ParE1/3/4